MEVGPAGANRAGGVASFLLLARFAVKVVRGNRSSTLDRLDETATKEVER